MQYPTLTARYDTDNQTAKVYVVFNCQGFSFTHDTARVYIVEKTFPTDINIIPTNTLEPIGFAYAHNQINGLMIDRWGLTTINSSLNGNYIAWNDTLLGIKAGFKRPENSGYITNLISFKFNDNTNYNALFPSLNTFSMIPYGEDNASLVWQETTNEFLPNASSKIYYTMLRTDQDLDIYHYAPPTVCDPNEPYFWDFTRKISDPNVLCISPNPPLTYYTFPQIYRNVESVMDNGNILALAAGDRVYWQGGVTKNVRSSIYAKMIDIGSYDCFNFMYPKKIYSNLTQLSQPNASQGDLNLDPAQGPFNWSDSSYVVNFIEYASNTNPPDYNSNIYQFHHNYWGFFSVPGGDWLPSEEFYQNLIWEQSPIGQGLYPHLVESSVLRKAGDWKINNHIFESNSQSIKTSYKYFFKGEQESKYSYPMLKFVNVNNQKEESFSFAAISDENDIETKRILKVNAFKKSGISMQALDTVFSSWFKINSIRDLSFFTDGNRLDSVTLKIERKSDNRIFEIPRKRSLTNKMMMNKLHLVNGKNDSYRVIWLRNKDSVIMSSDILFSPEIDFNLTDTLSSKSLGKTLALEEQIIDLSNNSSYTSTEEFELIAYPNPATDIIYASALLPLEILKENTNIELTYILANSIGTEIERTTASSGAIVNFKTHNLSSGAYFIKVEANTYSLNPLSKSKSIIISR